MSITDDIDRVTDAITYAKITKLIVKKPNLKQRDLQLLINQTYNWKVNSQRQLHVEKLVPGTVGAHQIKCHAAEYAGGWCSSQSISQTLSIPDTCQIKEHYGLPSSTEIDEYILRGQPTIFREAGKQLDLPKHRWSREALLKHFGFVFGTLPSFPYNICLISLNLLLVFFYNSLAGLLA